MRVEELERELRAERPQPDHEFARRLDEWAEAGFPRDRGLGPGAGSRIASLRRLWDRVGSTPPRRLLLPAGAVATVLVIAGVAVSRNGSESTGLPASSAPAVTQSEAAPPAAADGATKPAAPPSTDDVIEPVPPPPSPGNGIARGADQRIVDASARIALGAAADEVQGVANRVVEVTDSHKGIVLTSQVTSDQAGARASFELEIPFKQLDATLADLSGLADVISRTQGAEDITARAVRARKDLAKTLAQIRKARIELIKADTREQRLVIKSQIASLEASADAQQTELNGVKRQGRFATVSVDVSSSGAGSDGNWSLGDALSDAGRVLEVIGGVALITLAIALPLSLIAALIAFVVFRLRRRAREQALDR